MNYIGSIITIITLIIIIIVISIKTNNTQSVPVVSESVTQSVPVVSESETQSVPVVSESVTQSVPVVSESVTQSVPAEFHPMLDYHNVVRLQNGLDPLKWDDYLATKAQEWGDYLKNSEKCEMRHPTRDVDEQNSFLPNNTGQNLYKGLSTRWDEDWSQNAITGWYNECSNYDPLRVDSKGVPVNFHDVGHFTQINWKDASKIGCAHISCNDKDRYGKLIVCNYDKGNIAGQFPEKVKLVKENCPSTPKWLKINSPIRKRV